MVNLFQDVEIEKFRVLFSTYFSGKCPLCGAKIWKVLDVWIHSVQDLGGPTRKRAVEVEMKRIQCLAKDCGAIFTPEHPRYPKGYHYSNDVILYGLTQAHRFSQSADRISIQLAEQHQVTVDPKTIQSWINSESETYFQAYFQRHPTSAKQDFKAITIDGTWFHAGNDLIGKKNVAGFSSVTKLADGTYLLTWWE